VEQDAPFVGLTIVDGTMTAGQVALAVVRKHFVAMLVKEAGTLEGTDPEELHDMRVATRRIRAALSLFKEYLHPEVQAFRSEFAWLGAALGGVRDLDVQLEHFVAWAKQLPGDQAERLVPVWEVLQRRRESARVEMVAALGSERYKSLACSFGELLLKGPLPEVDEAVLAVAPRLVNKRMSSFRKAADKLTERDPPESFHLARICAKKLRYAIEFFAAVYGKPAKDASAHIVTIQDILGLHQDSTVATTLIDDMAANEPLPAPTLFALGMLAQFVQNQAQRLRGEFPSRLKETRGREWRALRELMQRSIPVLEEPAVAPDEPRPDIAGVDAPPSEPSPVLPPPDSGEVSSALRSE
jgi:triphosphatase